MSELGSCGFVAAAALAGAVATTACTPQFTEAEYFDARLSCQRYFECFDEAVPEAERSVALAIGHAELAREYGVEGTSFYHISSESLTVIGDQCDERRERIHAAVPTAACLPPQPGELPSPAWQALVTRPPPTTSDPYAYQRGICEDYIACVSQITVEGGASAAAAFGPASACWQSTEQAQMCADACGRSLGMLEDTNPDECGPPTYVDEQICSYLPMYDGDGIGSESCWSCCRAFGAQSIGIGVMTDPCECEFYASRH